LEEGVLPEVGYTPANMQVADKPTINIELRREL
jgi:hypothetical protein